jgi:hypothetical protein
MSEETWFDSSAALAAGLVDEVLSEQGDLQGVAAKADLTKFRNLPSQIAARLTPKADPVPTYAPIYPTRSMEELYQQHERLLLAKRLRDLKYR